MSTKTEREKIKKLAEGIIVEIPMRGPGCRKHGRPKHGRAVFLQARIDMLPVEGRQSDVARALGIRLASVQQWCSLKKNPLPFVKDKSGRRMLKKTLVVKWLIATRRYKPKAEYKK